ncbi:MAG: ABC transporter ATP-binding protein [Candidatus Korobacteraceae bacterium]
MNPVEIPANPVTETNSQIKGDSPVVTLQELTKLFGRFAALRAVTAEFAPGLLYALLGDNGAGKSTLLRIMAGLAQPTRGSLRVLGASRPRDAALSVGFMGHAPLLYDDMTGVENLRYFAGLYGVTDEQVCADAIASVGLDPALKRRVGQYSQGMRQRLSLARAVVHNPRLLLLDEPFSNVDAASAIHMVKLLASMRNQGKTIFVVTHQPSLLAGVADESVMMAAGQIVMRAPGIQTSSENSQ